jgi:uncharacterized protein with PIN domain
MTTAPNLELVFSKVLVPLLSRKFKKCPAITYPIHRKASIKDIIESMGIPHTEIGKICSDRGEVDFGFVPQHSIKLNVFEIEPPFVVIRPAFLRPVPLKKIRFIADLNVSKLATLLRMSGIDTELSTDLSDREIALLSCEKQRIVLSKDLGLLKHRKITFGRYVRSIYPEDQLNEIIEFFNLKPHLRPFSRCLRCNTPLIPVEKKDIVPRLQPKTRKYYHFFKMCAHCDRIYWKGSHHEKMVKKMRRSGIIQT